MVKFLIKVVVYIVVLKFGLNWEFVIKSWVQKQLSNVIIMRGLDWRGWQGEVINLGVKFMFLNLDFWVDVLV